MSKECPTCDKKFSRPDSLKRHMKTVHNELEDKLTKTMVKSTAGHHDISEEVVVNQLCQPMEAPFTAMVVGPTQSGKTAWLKKLLENASRFISPPPQRIVWCYGAWQPMYSNMQTTIPSIEFIKGIPYNLADDDFFNPTISNLIVFDDLMSEVKDDKRLAKLFFKEMSHNNVSCVYIMQNLFQQGKESRTISLNTQYIVLFKNPRDQQQIKTLASQMYPGKAERMIKAYEDATKGPYGYLFIDLKPNTPDKCRLRTNILMENKHSVSSKVVSYLDHQMRNETPQAKALHSTQDQINNVIDNKWYLPTDVRVKELAQLQHREHVFQEKLRNETGIQPLISRMNGLLQQQAPVPQLQTPQPRQLQPLEVEHVRQLQPWEAPLPPSPTSPPPGYRTADSTPITRKVELVPVKRRRAHTPEIFKDSVPLGDYDKFERRDIREKAKVKRKHRAERRLERYDV